MNRYLKSFLVALLFAAYLSAEPGFATTPVAHTVDQLTATGGSAITVPSSGVWPYSAGGTGISSLPTAGQEATGNGSGYQLTTPVLEQQSVQCNGSTTSYTLAHTPIASATVLLHLDGQILRQGSGNDYTISGATITLASACATGQILYSFYKY